MKIDDKYTVSVHAQHEDIPVRGNAMASGDEAADKEVEDAIIRRRSVWAWACVEVRVSVECECCKETRSASDYLGACSYKNEADFRRHSGYFEDMVANCIAELEGNSQEESNTENKNTLK